MNILDYLGQEMRTFDQEQLGPLDSLALALLSMVRCDGIVPGPDEPGRGVRPCELLRAERFDHMLDGLACPENTREMLFLLAASPRFRDMRLWGYRELFDPDLPLQFCAMTASLPMATVVCFRGTDDTLAGWEEDFRMGVSSQVPAQAHAREYLEEVARTVDGPLVLTGHSKGGNLAAYACATADEEVAGRVAAVYSHDGPGILPDAICEQGRERLGRALVKTVPVESVVGLLMEDGPYRVTRSDGRGILQHDAFTWQADLKTGDFVLAPRVSQGALAVSRAFSDWMRQRGEDRLDEFVDALFAALGSQGAKSFSDLGSTAQETVGELATIAGGLEASQRDILLEALATYAASAVRAGGQTVADAVGSAVESSLGGLARLGEKVLGKAPADDGDEGGRGEADGGGAAGEDGAGEDGAGEGD